MTAPTEIERLTALVKKQANGSVQIVEGSTNGVPVLHVSKTGQPGISRTIRDSGEWSLVPNALNADNKHIEEEIN